LRGNLAYQATQDDLSFPAVKHLVIEHEGETLLYFRMWIAQMQEIGCTFKFVDFRMASGWQKNGYAVAEFGMTAMRMGAVERPIEIEHWNIVPSTT
jgi:hypothetical protein